MFGNDAADNGQPQPGTPPLGGKVGQEQLLLQFRGDAVAGIGDHHLHRLAAQVGGADPQLAHQRVFHGFGRVIDQVHDDTLEMFRVQAHERKGWAEIQLQPNPIQPPAEDRKGVLDDRVNAGGRRMRRGEARQLRELVHQLLQRVYFLLDQQRALTDHPQGIGGGIACQIGGGRRSGVPRRGFARAAGQTPGRQGLRL